MQVECNLEEDLGGPVLINITFLIINQKLLDVNLSARVEVVLLLAQLDLLRGHRPLQRHGFVCAVVGAREHDIKCTRLFLLGHIVDRLQILVALSHFNFGIVLHYTVDCVARFFSRSLLFG